LKVQAFFQEMADSKLTARCNTAPSVREFCVVSLPRISAGVYEMIAHEFVGVAKAAGGWID
jgi:hypothetical protein